MLTDKLFTGQREMADLGIYHYQARFYSPYINRFLSADTIVPDYTNPQSLNRYSYVVNNPLRYTDPTGHDHTECGERSNYRCKIHKKKVAEAEARGAAEAAAQPAAARGTCTALVCVTEGTFTSDRRTTPIPSHIPSPAPATGGANPYNCFTNPASCGKGTPTSSSSSTENSSEQTGRGGDLRLLTGFLALLEGFTFAGYSVIAYAAVIAETGPIGIVLGAPFLFTGLVGANWAAYGAQEILYSGSDREADPIILVHLVFPNLGK